MSNGSMDSRIMHVIERYAKYESILPEKILRTNFNELISIREEIDSIMKEDMKTIKKMLSKNNKKIEFRKFRDLGYLIKIGFPLRGVPLEEDEKTYCAHWYMSMVTLEILSKLLFGLSEELVKYYKKYKDSNTAISNKRISYHHYSRTWLDFQGYLVNIKETIYQYHDLFVRALNKIDPENNAKTYYAFKSGGSSHGLHSAVKELILLGNTGRLEGFSLLRSMIEIHITREVFNLSNNPKYKGKTIEFSGSDITSVPAICNCIERLNLNKIFKSDIIRRIYNWGSIVSHRGPRTDEYITWFARGVAADICNLFSSKIPRYRNRILKNLQNTNQIRIVQSKKVYRIKNK